MSVIDDSDLELRPGVHTVTEPFRLTGAAPRLSGTMGGGRPATTLRRGTLADGSLYDGPLILVEDAENARIEDLVIAGARFPAPGVDRRHPIDADPAAADFPFTDAALTRRAVDVGPDCLVVRSEGVSVEGVVFDGAIRIACAIGAGCRRVTVRDCRIRRAGDYGLWIASGLQPDDPVLPMAEDYVAQTPRSVRVEGCLVEDCGAAGIYTEGHDLALERVRLVRNCRSAPYDDEGGQLTVDYKARGVRVERSLILAGPAVARRTGDGGTRVLGSFGAEICGEDVVFRDTIVEGNAREGVQIVGGRRVVFAGETRIINNHLAQFRHAGHGGHPERQNLSVTTTGALAAVGAVAADIRLEGVTCENGLIVWSDGSVPDMRLDGLLVAGCDLSGPDHVGIAVGTDRDGRSLRGADWRVDGDG